MKKYLLLIALAAAVTSQANVQFVTLGGGAMFNVTNSGTTRTVFAGELKMKNLNTNANFVSYCADLDAVIGFGQSWNCFETLASTVSVNMAAAGRITGDNFFATSTNEQKAGLQVAIWEAIYDNGTNGGGNAPDFSAGVFSAAANATILGWATTYYASVLVPGDAQYIEPIPTNAGQAQLYVVPEPASMAVLGAGVVALLRRRKK